MKRMKKCMIILALIISLTACGNTDTGPERESTTGGTVGNISAQEGSSWHSRHIRLNRQYAAAAISDDHIYACYYENGHTVLEYLHKDTGTQEKEVDIFDTLDIRLTECDREGNVYLLGNDNEGRFCLWKIDGSGKAGKTDIASAEEARNRTGLLADEEGFLYVWYDSDFEDENNVFHEMCRVMVLDPELNILFYEDRNRDDFIGLFPDEEGKAAILAADADGVYIQRIDPKAQGTEELMRFKEAENIGRNDFMVPQTNGFLYCAGLKQYFQESLLKYYDIGTQKTEPVLDLSSCGIHPSDILAMRAEGNIIEIIDNHREEGNSEYSVLELKEGETQDTVVLTLGTMTDSDTGINSDLAKLITDFNRSSENVQVEIVSYNNGDWSDIDGAYEKLKRDILTGDAPDIIDVSGIDYSILSSKGVLADLYAFMKEDKELNQDMLMPSVLKAYELGGKLYTLGCEFNISTVLGSREIFGDSRGLSIKELQKLLRDNGKETDAFWINTNSPQETLNQLLYNGMDEFVDWEHASCSFDSEGFKDVLAFAGEYKKPSENMGLRDMIRTGRILAEDTEVIWNVTTFQILRELFGGEVSIIGYPTQGEEISSTAWFLGEKLAINEKGAHKDLAWEFVKYFILHYREYYEVGFPVLKSQFEEMMEDAMKEESEQNPDGTYTKVIKDSYRAGNETIYIYAATQEDVDGIRSIVDSIRQPSMSHGEIMEIIEEEAEYYFQGQKSLDEVTDVIQSRVQLYLDEQ